MKRTYILAISAAILGLVAFAAAAVESAAPAKCTLETLHGTMAWGAAQSTQNGTVRSGAGFESYDGKGHMKYSQIASDGLTNTPYTGTATYTITPDSIASVIYDGFPPTYQYFVAPDCSTYFWSFTTAASNVSAGKAELVSRALLVR